MVPRPGHVLTFIRQIPFTKKLIAIPRSHLSLTLPFCMVQTLFNHNAVDEVTSFRDLYSRAYRLMLLARVLDDKFASLSRMGKIHGGVFLGRGQEALSVASGLALTKGDIFAPLIRDGAGRLAFGEPMLDAMSGPIWKLGAEWPMQGHGMAAFHHAGRPKEGLFVMKSSHLRRG